MTTPDWFKAVTCVLPKRSDTVAGGPAHDEASLWVRASLAHLIHAACRPHLPNTHLGLLLEVVSWSGNDMSTGVNTRTHTHTLILTLDLGINLIHGWMRWGAAKMFLTHTCAYLALAITSMSLNRKRCLSWVCIPVFNWACPCRRNDLLEPVRKDWTNGQVSGHTGTRKLSLEYKNMEPNLFYSLKYPTTKLIFLDTHIAYLDINLILLKWDIWESPTTCPFP